MKKKIFAVIIVLLLVSGTAFTQNAIIIDFGPTLLGAAVQSAFDMMPDMEESGFSSSGFGFGISGQYERMLFFNLSVGGKFGYLGFGFGVDDLSVELKSFTLEAHGRYRPLGGTFFIGAMIGYGNLDFAVSDSTNKANLNGNYMNVGAKLGWGTNFNKSMGLTFEMSFGYYYGFRLGGNEMYDKLISDFNEVDDAMSMIENMLFIGGPRFTIGVGWRF